MIVIPKQHTSQKYVFKIHSARLRKADWNLTLPLSEARKNDELISLGDSQIMRWIDELNNITNADSISNSIRNSIKSLRKQPNSLQNRREIKRLYSSLDKVQHKPDYMCLVIDRVKDYRRACKGFSINGVRYVRLLGTNGGVKNKTIVFVSERLSEELRRRIENGRNPDVKLVPAKYEAYRALTCSGSTPVTPPKGILVVDDCETQFTEDVIYLTDENDGDPTMEYRQNEPIRLVESDGYGLILPSLAKKWSEDLGLDYVASGFNTRYSFEKGMLFCFDFIKFADDVAHTRIVKDAWGNNVDISDVEVVLTTSMLKLWSSYNSIEHYLRCCEENHYTMSVAKVCPKELESERNLNYQFIQSYDLSDEQIERLISPTITEIHDILSGDYAKAILFLKGMYLNSNNIDYIDNDFAKALMIDPRAYNDPYVKKRIHNMIRKRINDAKIGVIRVHGNYSIVSGDPYSLCQSAFGLPVTGILKAGEIYNKYWCDRGTERLSCFRAPMTCHNNIRLVRPCRSEDAKYWYQHMTTCTILNSWDTIAHALNGADKDGDLVMLTDNEVLVECLQELPTIMCVQRGAQKKVITEEDLVASNIDSFGDDIGKTTNWITSMFEVQANYKPSDLEYQILSYRIRCGQLYQQNAIDKAKGIIAKPMPKRWYEKSAIRDGEVSGQSKELDLRIVADKKPYFMRYIYPDLMNQYNTYIKNTDKKSMREFRRPIGELVASSPLDLSSEELRFLEFYQKKMPVGTRNCVMNRICRRFEEEFDGYLSRSTTDPNFDYRVLKGGHEYTSTQHTAVNKLYSQYTKRLQEYVQAAKRERVDEDESAVKRMMMIRDFKADCYQVCSNTSQLCDILLDLCYSKNGSKQFCWDVCCEEIIDNLLANNNHYINYPVMDEDGDIEFCGHRFRMETKEVWNGNNNSGREDLCRTSTN